MALIERPHRGEEGGELGFVEHVVGAHAAAEIKTIRPDLRVRGREVVGAQAAGEEDGAAAGLDDAARDGPVVGAAGTAEFLDREIRIAGIEQDEIDFRRDGGGLGDGFLAADVDDLDEFDSGNAWRRSRCVPRVRESTSWIVVVRQRRCWAMIASESVSAVRRNVATAGGTDAAISAMRFSAITPGPLGMGETSPSAAAPCASAVRASAADLMQQILTSGAGTTPFKA